MPHLPCHRSHQVSSQQLRGSTAWVCIGPTSPVMWTVVALVWSSIIHPWSAKEVRSEMEKHLEIQKKRITETQSNKNRTESCILFWQPHQAYFCCILDWAVTTFFSVKDQNLCPQKFFFVWSINWNNLTCVHFPHNNCFCIPSPVCLTR